ncbi:urease accessory protein UreD, partial [Actinomadura fibrosa]
ACSLALPGDGPSRSSVRAEVGAGGHLDVAPEPVVAAGGCDHRSAASVALAAGATLRWRDELVLGRHGEQPGRHSGRLDVTVGGAPLLRHELRLDDPDVHLSSAVLDGAGAVGSVLLVGEDLTAEPHTGDGLSVLPLAVPQAHHVRAVLITATAEHSAELRRRLVQGERMAQSALAGTDRPAPEPTAVPGTAYRT